MSLSWAYEHGLEVEDDEPRTAARPPPQARTVAPRGVSSALTTTSKAASQTSTASVVALTPSCMVLPPGTRFSCLTQAEMADRRMKGLCFNCLEKFSKEHLRHCTMKGIYLLELNESAAVDEGYIDDGVEISLYALIGVNEGGTMHLEVVIGTTVLRSLIDSSSTHSFLAESTAVCLGRPTSLPGFSVNVANGDRVPSVGICEGVRVRIGQEEFNIDFYITPHDGYEVVLGC